MIVSALRFDGSGYVDLANTVSLNFGASGFILAAWVRYSTLGTGEYMIISKHSAGFTNGYFIDVGRNWDPAVNTNRLDFYFNRDGTRIVTPYTYDDNQWHFVVGTNDGSIGSLYVDGQFISSEPGTPYYNGVDLIMGGVFLHTGVFICGFIGDIDDVRVHDKAMTQAEIGQLYQSILDLGPPLTNGLQGYWQFDGSGLDSSGHGRDLTLNGTGLASTGLMGQA
ncbi:MAG: LamG domain-containing protein [bacterium]